MNTSRQAATRRRIGSSIRTLLIALVVLLAVVVAFAAGIGIYAAAPVWQPLFLAWWPGLLPGAVTIVALGAWWLWWRLPKWQVDHFGFTIPDRAAAEDNYRKTIGQLLGGAAVLIGAGFAYLQFQQQQTSAHDLLISNQVAKGFELLGNKEKDLSQRLGGIYALEGVMNGSEQYHQPVIEALCAFVRDQTKPKGSSTAQTTQPKAEISPDNLPPLAADIQAALTVIGRRKPGPGLVDLGGAQIPKALLFDAILDHALLTHADLSGATLSGAILDHTLLGHADLSGANLVDANLEGAGLYSADLTGADLSGATLSGAILTHANLDHANLLGAILTHANLSGAFMGDADLRGAKGLTQGQLDAACGNEKTALDLQLKIKPCPPAAGSAK